MHCAGSTTLIRVLGLPQEEEEPAYRIEGSCAHAAAAECLQTGADAWEVVGREFEGMALRGDMAVGVQTYLDVCRPLQENAHLCMIETGMAAPHLHPAMFGTTDFAAVVLHPGCMVLEIVDYKNGAGISVDVVENPQEMYYARLVLDKLEREQPELYANIDTVRLTIVQPNDFNPAGKVRQWVTSKDHILEWAGTELLPAMRRADAEEGLMVGDHCRFCPAKLICPAQRSLFAAIAERSSLDLDLEPFTDEALNRDYTMIDAVMHHKRAIEGELYRRMMTGSRFADAKLVEKQADRIWKDGSRDRFTAQFGTKAFRDPAMRSPAEMEKLGPDAKKLTREWAYTPHTGLTVVPRSTKRIEVKPPSPSRTFQAAMTQQETE
jgi:hypothetical protein